MMLSACGGETKTLGPQGEEPQASETMMEENKETPPKESYSPEEIDFIESQEGATVTEDGVIEIDISDMFQ